MSTTVTTDVLDRTMHDEAFLDWFRAAPAEALAGYDLTEAERAALEAGDEDRVREGLGDLALATAVVVIVIGLPW